MDPVTVAVYEAAASSWAARRPPRFLDALAELAAAVPPGAVVADLGCGTGGHLAGLPRPVLALDAAYAMAREAQRTAPDTWVVRGDLEALPLATGSLGGVWARASYLHVPRERLPLALADLHRALAVGAPLTLVLQHGAEDGPAEGDDYPGRTYVRWRSDRVVPILTGAGFAVVRATTADGWITVRATRERTLPDLVAPGMRLLVVGLNPSLASADAGVPFARPGNRFWPALLDAGLVERDRDPWRALRGHGIGFTDLVKRATPRADGLSAAEYRAGLDRVASLAQWLRPDVVCLVGLAGWRAVVDRHAAAGPQTAGLGGRPVYLMPSTSGANAHADRMTLATHLRSAAALRAADPGP